VCSSWARADQLVAGEIGTRTRLGTPPHHFETGFEPGATGERADFLGAIDIELDVVGLSVCVADLVEAAAVANPPVNRDRPALVRLAELFFPPQPLGMVQIEDNLAARPNDVREPGERFKQFADRKADEELIAIATDRSLEDVVNEAAALKSRRGAATAVAEAEE